MNHMRKLILLLCVVTFIFSLSLFCSKNSDIDNMIKEYRAIIPVYCDYVKKLKTANSEEKKKLKADFKNQSRKLFEYQKKVQKIMNSITSEQKMQIREIHKDMMKCVRGV